MVGLTGLEPVTPRLSSVCSNQLSYKPYQKILDECSWPGGAEEIRTPDILLAKQTLYQLSYSPINRPGHSSWNPGSCTHLKAELCDQQLPHLTM